MSKSPGLGDLWNIRGERETEGESEIRIKDCLDYCLELVGGSEKERKGRRERYLRGKDSVDMFVMSGLGVSQGNGQQEVGHLECSLFIRKDPKLSALCM